MTNSSEPRAFAVIPARAGSVRVPNKNFRSYQGGHSLCERAVQVSMSAKFFSNVILTSDSFRAEEIAKSFGCFLHKRPKESSSSKSSASDVLSALVGTFQTLGIRELDYVFYLQPTSPSRSTELLMSAWDLIRERDLPGIISVAQVDESPYKLLHLDSNGVAESIFGDIVATSNSQELEPTFRATGDLFAFRWGEFLDRGVFPVSGCSAIVLENWTDIDTHADFELSAQIET